MGALHGARDVGELPDYVGEQASADLEWRLRDHTAEAWARLSAAGHAAVVEYVRRVGPRAAMTGWPEGCGVDDVRTVVTGLACAGLDVQSPEATGARSVVDRWREPDENQRLRAVRRDVLGYRADRIARIATGAALAWLRLAAAANHQVMP